VGFWEMFFPQRVLAPGVFGQCSGTGWGCWGVCAGPGGQWVTCGSLPAQDIVIQGRTCALSKHSSTIAAVPAQLYCLVGVGKDEIQTTQQQQAESNLHWLWHHAGKTSPPRQVHGNKPAERGESCWAGRKPSLLEGTAVRTASQQLRAHREMMVLREIWSTSQHSRWSLKVL
uniref:Uncharacterized protein n=1 Tax=Catharus ustulatus TaxID=91951 RepID=A0A8C3Y8B3_CATUS